MIVAVIVTYNRKELLGENIRMLLRQTRPFDKIFIIDNCSTDGTADYLLDNGWKDCEPFVYIKTDSNIGGAGGFYSGTRAAFDAGADWIVLMDDDGRMADEHTLELLYASAIRFYNEGRGNKKLFLNTLVQQGNQLSFKIRNMYTVEDAVSAADNGILEGEANPFNGTMISKELVAEIGYPNRDFFIKGDEVNYKQRALDAGAYVATLVYSRYIHPRLEMHEKVVLGVKVPFYVEAPWKEYYTARNFAYMYKQKGWYKGIAFELIFVKILAVFSIKCRKFKTIQMLLKGIYDGWNGHLGATVKPK